MKQTIKCFIAVIAAMFVAVSAYAQITTSSLGGRVIDVNGEPVIGAAVVATHEPSGTVYGVVTNEDGRYTINGMRSGGPYKVEISCLGYQTVINTDVTLQLAEQFSLNSTLNEDKEMLSEAVVIGQAASRFAGEKTGAATNISSAQMESLPTVSRSITDITKLSPYGGSGTSFAGMDGRSSNFTVDGANFNNNFGLSSGLPGGGSPISIDAIDEVQVVVSPYDVRQTNFIGGGINAITKSGTNQFRGTAYVYHRNENMRGNVVDGTSLGEREMDRYTTYGFTLGGPIIKNKLFFFANFEYSKAPTVVNRWRPSKDGVANPDLYISRTTVEDMEKVKKHLAGYGYDAGSYTDYPADESNMKLLARIDWNITDKHHLAVRYNHTLNRGWNNTNASSSNCTQRTTEGRLSQYAMAFSNSMYSMDNKVNSVTLDLNSRFTNNLSNQFLATFSQLDDIRGTNSSKFPFIDILDGSGKIMPYISAGYELFTWNNGVHNQVLTIKDDLTYYLGNHKIMGGFSFEYQMADNSYMRNGTGYYRYSSLDDFLTGAAPETVAITYGYDGELNPAARVRFNQYGLYAQDEWSATDNFKLTYGLRFDAIAFNNADLMRNNAIYELDYAGKHIDTGAWPTTKIQVSPRVGFSWDVLGDKSLKVRGGTGLFAGRLPLVFFTNMPTNSGMVQNVAAISTSYKDGVAVPDELLQHFKGQMITDVDKLVAKLNSLNGKKFPTSISPEDGVLPSQIQAVDPKFKMPQVWKTSIAVDYQIPVTFPFTVSGEFIYNKTINGVNMSNWNISDYTGWAQYQGSDNRYIYPANYKYNSVDAYVLTNTNRGYGYTANLTMSMEPVKNLNIMASYTHTVSKELTGMPGSNAESAFTYTPTVNGPNFAPLHNSEYATPDRLIASLSYRDQSNNSFSLFYEAWRGGYKYTYMYDNDFNGDNYNYDVMYIPKDENDIKFASADDAARYWAFANNDPYLSKHKGEYAEAYSVYSPWVHRFDFRYSHDFKINIGKSTNTLQLNVDFKNIANLFNSSWGVSKYMNPALKSGRILALDHVDEAGYPVFKTNAAVKPGVQTWHYNHDIYQCWSLQIGIKYMFN
jgi:hypothetical protein